MSGGIFIGIGIIIASSVLMQGFKDVKNANKTIEVKGSAEAKIISDFATWGGYFSVRDANMTDAYKKLEESKQKVMSFLVKQGIAEDKIIFDPARVDAQYKRDVNGVNTNEIEMYEAVIDFKVQLQDTTLIDKVAKQSTDLIHQGVKFTSNKPSFIYTKIDEVKISLLADAAKDAKVRAEQLAKTGGGKLGSLKSIRQGVFQITPEFSNEVSDYGYYDTTTVNKSVKAVITSQYALGD
ncbi:hypothetical protein GQ61_00770 [Candidatus Nucleicultrix amoebiphila FS5]|uniref:SIMPL domain-containing protein n=1 Tax=Candidatus Nucleicultrix amoebiphila FS5 TaxID=1414854 RepID=A0A1W6N2R0_9PROT|nr:hypothetical protein GQ61_00770 [Candidatus Nucleicultrix amoebiphila FS5]